MNADEQTVQALADLLNEDPHDGVAVETVTEHLIQASFQRFMLHLRQLRGRPMDEHEVLVATAAHAYGWTDGLTLTLRLARAALGEDD